MDGKVFLATYIDGSEKVLGDGAIFSGEPYIEGRWVDFGDPSVKNATWEAWMAEEIVEIKI